MTTQEDYCLFESVRLAIYLTNSFILTDVDQTESNNRNKRFVQENIFYEPLRTWTSGHSNERFFTSDEAIIESGIKERDQIRNYDFKIAKDALESLGYVQEEKRINGVKARWWFKRT